MAAGDFYEESIKAAQQLGRRAVLLIGKTDKAPNVMDSSIYVTDYAPYSELLPRAAATVHQGGIGTTAQALRAGRPMIIVPGPTINPTTPTAAANWASLARSGASRIEPTRSLTN